MVCSTVIITLSTVWKEFKEVPVADYLVRATFEGPRSATLRTLPKTFGDFTLDWSKNVERFEFEQGWYDPENPPKAIPAQDEDYPMSWYHLDAVVCVQENENKYEEADKRLARLEALFRVFRPGDVAIRRYNVWPLDESARRRPLGFSDFDLDLDLDYKPPPPESFRRYSGPFDYEEYKLDDEGLELFAKFYENHWPETAESEPLYVAIARFSSACEKWTLADRLIDLMIGLEALFGERNEITYKIALRTASFLYPPGEERTDAFYKIKRIYEERSNLVHGRKLELETKSKIGHKDVEEFEDLVRRAIMKLLCLFKTEHKKWAQIFRKEENKKLLDEMLFLRNTFTF